MPYSGPASAYGVIGKIEDAYFKMINEQGGINGRKINFVAYDDSYSPPKALEQDRKLFESDEVPLRRTSTYRTRTSRPPRHP
jgi:branched-chain amino acid transport system substrate-binding protein